MPRQLRIQYPGALYHITARGNRQENIVHDDMDREMLLTTLAEVCQKTGWEVLAWVIMDNHYHWLLRTPKPNLVAGMSWFQGTYTQRYNARHRMWGHLFGGRYKAIPVQPQESGGSDYLKAVMDYIHLNPVRGKILNNKRNLGLADYRWSSLIKGYGLLPEERPNWLKIEEGLRLFDLPDTTMGRCQFIERLEQKRKKERPKDCGLPNKAICKGGQNTLRRGWFWGAETFEKWLRNKVREAGSKPEGRALRMTAESKACHDEEEAQLIIADGMKWLRLKELELKKTLGSEPRKVAIAHVVHQKTAMARKWTAARLQMKSAMNVSQQIKRLKTGQLNLPDEVKQWLSRMDSSFFLASHQNHMRGIKSDMNRPQQEVNLTRANPVQLQFDFLKKNERF
jgi:putative transposase